MNDYTVSRQWASRPDDERFLSIDALREHVSGRKDRSRDSLITTDGIEVIPSQDGSISIGTDDGSFEPTNWSFSQLCRIAGAPSNYLATLSPENASACLEEGLQNTKRHDHRFLSANGGEGRPTLRAVTSPTYGRIWDLDVVDEVMKLNELHGGRWHIPSASYQGSDPLRATTLYASDRDVFMFLVDEENPIDFKGEELKRGFFVYNSETGARTFGLCLMLYRRVCDNRIIWGVEERREFEIRHTRNAPARFDAEITKTLREYSESSTSLAIEHLTRASERLVAKDREEAVEFMYDRVGLSSKELARKVVARAEEEEGDFRTAYQLTNGLTAYAREIPFTNERVSLERKASKVIELAQARN